MGLSFLNLNSIAKKTRKSTIGTGLIRETMDPVCLNVSTSNKVRTKTKLIAPKIRPAVAGLSVVKASETIFEFLNANIILAIIRIIIIGPVTKDKVARIPPIGPYALIPA